MGVRIDEANLRTVETTPDPAQVSIPADEGSLTGGQRNSRYLLNDLTAGRMLGRVSNRAEMGLLNAQHNDFVEVNSAQLVFWNYFGTWTPLGAAHSSGPTFPSEPETGQTHWNTSTSPGRQYEYDGSNWI